MPVPAPAQTWGFTQRTFFDDFLDTSTIDLNDTQQAGYNWYLHNRWSNIAVDIWNIKTADPTLSSSISVADSILTLNNPTNAASCNMMFSSACQAANADGYIGRTFRNGFYVEFSLMTDQSLQTSTFCWPAIWSLDIQMFTGQVTTWAELDYFETIYGRATCSFYEHAWIGSGTDYFLGGAPTDVPEGFKTADWHTYGSLWVPMARNGGTGLIRRYIDGVLQTGLSVDYGPPTSYFASMDTAKFIFLFLSGQSWPLNVDYISIWQAPPTFGLIN